MSKLSDMQKNLQAFVLQSDESALQFVGQPHNMSAKERLQIYRNAYYIRLVDILAGDFAVLQKVLGEATFASMARSYLDHFPSNHYSVNGVGQHMTKFLEGSKDCDKSLVELADFEWTLNTALVARDVKQLTMTELAQIPPERWAGMVLELHPAVNKVTYLYNTVQRWETLHNGAEDIGQQLLDQPAHHLIWRSDRQAFFTEITEQQVYLYECIRQGQSFEQLCEAMLEHFAEDTVVAWVATSLQDWVERGVFGVFASSHC